MTKFALTVLIATAVFGNVLGQHRPRPSRTLLNANKPGVYISFLRAATIEPLETGVSDRYLWFRITNNTRWPIWLKMTDVPKAYGDAALSHTIEDPDKLRLDARCHKCLVNPVASGRSIVFSIPRDHASRDAFMRIKYSFAWERENENDGGSFSAHYVDYSFDYLPKTVW